MCIYIYIYIYVCMYVCVYIYIYIYIYIARVRKVVLAKQLDSVSVSPHEVSWLHDCFVSCWPISWQLFLNSDTSHDPNLFSFRSPSQFSDVASFHRSGRWSRDSALDLSLVSFWISKWFPAYVHIYVSIAVVNTATEHSMCTLQRILETMS